DGFRDGIDAGKEASLQQGFNLGYREGAVKMKAIGQFKGILSALRCWSQSHPSVSSESITQLLQKVEKYEEGLFEAMRKAQELPPPSISELVGDMDDLGMDQSDHGSCRNDKDDECCQKGQSDCCGPVKDINESSAGIHTETLFMNGESLEQLLHSNNEDGQENAVISTQPVAAPKLAEGSAQSSYGSVIQMLHTDVSLAAHSSQSASPVSKASHEPEDATTPATETKEDDDTAKEIQISATEDTDTLPVSTPTELATAIVKEETQVELSDALEQEDKSGVHELTVPDATAKSADELHVVQMDAQKEVPEEDTEMRSAEVDKNSAEVSAEMNNKREAGEVDTEVDELKAPVEVLPPTDILQTEEPVLSDLTVDGLKSKRLLTSVDVADNSAHLLPDNSNSEHLASLSQPSSDVEKTPLAIEKVVVGKGLEIHEEDVGVKEDFLPPKTQETPESVNIIEESTVNYIENGQADDLTDGDLKDEKPVEVNVEEPLSTEVLQKPCEEPSHTENQELLHEPPTNSISVAEELEKREPTDTTETQETIAECVQKEGEVQQAFQNGLLTPAPVEKPHSTEEPDEHVDENEPESKDPGPSETFSLEHVLAREGEPAPQACENDEMTAGDEKENAGRTPGQKGEEIVLSSSPDIKVALIPVSDIENITEKDEQEQNEDLYRGDEEMDQEQDKEVKLVPLLEFTIPGVEDKCSLDDPVDIMEYREREWKGNTAKSNLIRKGYAEMYCSFTGLRRVRGDNYCSLRATLYQVLASTTRTPAWLLEEDFTSLPEKIEAQEQLIGMWVFPPQCVKAREDEDPVDKLKHYLELLQKRWQAAAESESLEDKQAVCSQVFQGGEEEYALLEVLKFLMLVKAVEFHNQMLAEEEVPVFCWLLFARDTSENPKMFFNNHLRQVGFTGGLEQ
ncbi:microtubule-associated protein futsch-like isoform X1, partial [Clarias magur]